MAHSLGNVRFGTLHGWTAGEKSNHNSRLLSLFLFHTTPLSEPFK